MDIELRMFDKSNDEGKSGFAKSLTSQQQLAMQDLLKNAPSDETLRISRLTRFFDTFDLGIKCNSCFSFNKNIKVINHAMKSLSLIILNVTNDFVLDTSEHEHFYDETESEQPDSSVKAKSRASNKQKPSTIVNKMLSQHIDSVQGRVIFQIVVEQNEYIISIVFIISFFYFPKPTPTQSLAICQKQLEVHQAQEVKHSQTFLQ